MSRFTLFSDKLPRQAETILVYQISAETVFEG